MTLARRWLIIAILLGAFFLQSLASITTKSATFDEVQYFGIGKYLLQQHKWDIMGAILHPPLSFYVSSLPLLFVHEDKNFWEYGEQKRDLAFLGSLDFLRGQGFLSLPENADDRLLIASRLMILLCTLPLGYYIYRFSRELYGDRGGLLSLALFAFCPNMLAFSGIAVPDMLLTVFMFVTVYYCRCFLLSSGYGNAVLAGVALGLALATKFTALLLLPLLAIIAGAYLLKEKKLLSGKSLFIAAAAFLVFFALYRFDLTPFFQGNEHRLAQMKSGQAAFFHGTHSNSGWWYFYPAVIFLKTPLPVLLLLIAATAVLLKYRRLCLAELVVLYLPVVVTVIVFSSSSFSVGVRYILPIYPFIFVICGAAATFSSRLSKVAVVIALAWHVGASLSAAPHYLSYFNELSGGSGNGYKYLVDSNLDWGQDLKGLKRYMTANGIKRISLSYFGGDSPQRYGIEYDWLPSHYLYNPQPENPVNVLANRFLAISATNLQGVYFDNRDEFSWLRQYEPVAKIGYSIFVYDLSRIVP